MAYFTDDKLVAYGEMIVNHQGTPEDRVRARQYLLDYANYLEILVARYGSIMTQGYLSVAAQARRIATLTED